MGIRSGRVDSRRRRVLLDDAQQNEETVHRPRSRRRPQEAVVARRYSLHAEAQRQPRVTDLIPTRWWTLIVLSLTLLTLAVAVHTLHLFTLVYGRIEHPTWSALALRFGGTLCG